MHTMFGVFELPHDKEIPRLNSNRFFERVKKEEPQTLDIQIVIYLPFLFFFCCCFPVILITPNLIYAHSFCQMSHDRIISILCHFSSILCVNAEYLMLSASQIPDTNTILLLVLVLLLCLANV